MADATPPSDPMSASESTSKPTTPPLPKPVLNAAAAQALSRRLAEEQSKSRLPSIAAGLVRRGELVWADAVGTLDGRAGGEPATPGTHYRIGSITKPFVAVEVLRLRDEGRLDLGDTIGTHLPEVGFGGVTIAQLLSHTSGLQAETNSDWWERTPGGDWASLIASSPRQVFTPGTTFHYSNTGFAVLGELVARLRGVPWDVAVHDGILQPLGMQRTTTRPQAPAAQGLGVHPLADLAHPEPEHDAGALAPAGQLWSTVEDLTRFAALLGGHAQGVLSPETRAEMLRPVAVSDVPGVAWSGAHAMGVQIWNVDGRRYAGHGGSMPGFLAGLRVDLESGDGIVVFANATSGLAIGNDLFTILAEHDPVLPTPWSLDGDQGDVLDLVGEWYWGTTLFTLKAARDGELGLGTPGQGRGARFRRDGDVWVGREAYFDGEVLRVGRDADGRPTHLDVGSFVFTRTPYDPAAPVPGGVVGFS